MASDSTNFNAGESATAGMAILVSAPTMQSCRSSRICRGRAGVQLPRAA